MHLWAASAEPSVNMYSQVHTVALPGASVCRSTHLYCTLSGTLCPWALHALGAVQPTRPLAGFSANLTRSPACALQALEFPSAMPSTSLCLWEHSSFAAVPDYFCEVK